jgi:hypothetical protein
LWVFVSGLTQASECRLDVLLADNVIMPGRG